MIVAEVVGVKRIPLLGKGGVAAPSRNIPVPLKGADGVVRSNSKTILLNEPPRLRPAKVAARHFIDGRSHPSFAKEGNSGSFCFPRLLQIAWRDQEFCYLGADTNFHVNVRPAALETAAAVSASIVDLCAQNVFTGHAEGGGRRHFAVRVHFGFGVGEGYSAGSAELAPRDRCRWVVVGSC